MTLAEMTAALAATDAAEALNLDGGGSSVMVVHGRIMSRPSDEDGERAVRNALAVVSDPAFCRPHPDPSQPLRRFSRAEPTNRSELASAELRRAALERRAHPRGKRAPRARLEEPASKGVHRHGSCVHLVEDVCKADEGCQHDIAYTLPGETVRMSQSVYCLASVPGSLSSLVRTFPTWSPRTSPYHGLGSHAAGLRDGSLPTRE